ncbi:porin [Glaciimonas sp. PCH181]|uniref:porin n=1 Tax=Glaciimonas sp. PCH181 TaxID=2133943 RepID=UPI000D39BD04|nr:porin [Glaciimonas sp. PCH181]PUA19516.1 porin [Glaciimonas sp. PCH181]
MNKKLFQSLAIAAPISLIAGIAAAQSNITIYGIIDASISRESNGAGAVTKMEPGVFNGSRLGFKGSEDLGGGLSATFFLENGFNPDDGSAAQGGRLFGRQSYIGLQGDFGAVRLGRQYAPIYLAQLTVDPFVGGMKGDMTSIRQWFSSGNFRVDNAITYTAPSYGNLTASVLYGLGEVAGNSAASRQMGFSVGYVGAPLTGTVSYHSTNDALGIDSVKVWFIGGAYNFGPFKLHAGADRVTSGGGAEVRDSMIGVSLPLQRSKLMASFIYKQNKQISDANARQVAFGYLFDLSKRTALYSSVAFVKNDRNSAINAGGVQGATDKVFDIGLRQTF